EDTLRHLSDVLLESRQRDWVAQPTLVTQRVAVDSDGADTPTERWHAIHNPANHQDTVGQAMFSDTTQLQATVDRAAIAMKTWQHTTAQERAQLLLKAADLLEERRYLRSEEHTSELQSRFDLVCRLLLEKKKVRRS